MTGVHISGKFRHRDRHGQREDNVKTRGEDSHVPGVMHLQAKECQGLQQISEARRARKDSPLEPTEQTCPCQYIDVELHSMMLSIIPE